MSPGQFVYLIQNEAGHVKVGVARDVRRRMAALQVANSAKLTLLCAIPGGFPLESALIDRWADHRLLGEWFEKAAPVDADIAALVDNEASASPAAPVAVLAGMPNEPIHRALALLGGQEALARAIGVKQANVWWWLNKAAGRVPAEQAIPIEMATQGAVTRRDLRPDLYPEEAA